MNTLINSPSLLARSRQKNKELAKSRPESKIAWHLFVRPSTKRSDPTYPRFEIVYALKKSEKAVRFVEGGERREGETPLKMSTQSNSIVNITSLQHYTRKVMNWFGKKKSAPSTTSQGSSSGGGGSNAGATIIRLKDSVRAQEKRWVNSAIFLLLICSYGFFSAVLKAFVVDKRFKDDAEGMDVSRGGFGRFT